MTTLTLQPVSHFPFIENGLKEIFGNDLLVESSGSKGKLHTLGELRQTLTGRFGAQETSGMYIRAGRAGFQYWMREFSTSMGWKGVAFKLLPPTARIKRALTDLLKWMEERQFCISTLDETQSAWQVMASGLAVEGARLDCSYFLGMLQELACWAGGGKFYVTREKQCEANGEKGCLFVIDKQPVV